MIYDALALLLLAVLTVAGAWLIAEMIWIVRELRRRSSDEDEE